MEETKNASIVQDYPLIGQNVEHKEEELQSIQQRQTEYKLKVMDDLDKIKVPIMCTVILPDSAFEYRNEYFWKAFQEKDKTIKLKLTEYLNSKKK